MSDEQKSGEDQNTEAVDANAADSSTAANETGAADGSTEQVSE